jgi:hypothetical protein
MFESKRSKVEGLIFHKKCFTKTDCNSIISNGQNNKLKTERETLPSPE